MTAPCKSKDGTDCPDRKLNCWSTCEKYKAYKAQRVLINQRRKKEHDEFDAWNSVFYRPRDKR
jgi:hypothetical protein